MVMDERMTRCTLLVLRFPTRVVISVVVVFEKLDPVFGRSERPCNGDLGRSQAGEQGC